MARLRIVTRKSPLAMWQAEHVAARLREAHPGLEVVIEGVMTSADRFLDRPLSAAGGKGLFVKELEHALLAGHADIAVHSVKDVPVSLPPGLAMPVVLKREDPRDVFVSPAAGGLEDLPPGARVGTSSLRRRCQLLYRRPDLMVLDIRGNVGTRLGKLDAGDFDALVLAAAGVLRLGLAERIREFLPTDVMLPAIGQGALGIECREDDAATRELIAPLRHEDTYRCVLAERALSRRMYGDCHVPIAGHAMIRDGELTLDALVGRLDGSELVRRTSAGPATDAEALGDALGREILDAGGDAILRASRHGG